MVYTRITAVWSGAAGLPGYSRFRFLQDPTPTTAAAMAARVRTFFDAVKGQIPNNVSINFAEAAQEYDGLGNLIGEVAFTPPAVVLGIATGSYAAPMGMVVNWLTGDFNNGRKIRGRTFLVPLSNGAFAADGTPAGTAVTNVTAAAQALAGGTPPMCIQYRFGVGSGGAAQVTGASVPKRAAVLKSRRD